MKKTLITFVLLLAVGLFLWADPFYYARNREESLQEVLDSLPESAVMYIEQGIYVFDEGLVIDNLTEFSLIGDGEVWLLCSDTNSDVISVTNGGRITLENLKMRHVTPLEEYECHGAVVKADSTENVQLLDCELNGCGAVGLYAQDCSSVRVEFCYIHDNSWAGLYLAKVDQFHMSYSTITDNNCFLTGWQIGMMDLHDNTIANNTPDW